MFVPPRTAVADSKINAEAAVRASSLKSVSLRIAGIAVPEFLEPPAVWPFIPEQRVEMVHRDDVVESLFSATRVRKAVGKMFNIGGGPSWQLTGRDYVRDFYDFLGAPVDEAVYRASPGWIDWYDTQESARVLGYQQRSYQHFSNEMRALVEAMMTG